MGQNVSTYVSRTWIYILLDPLNSSSLVKIKKWKYLSLTKTMSYNLKLIRFVDAYGPKFAIISKYTFYIYTWKS